MQRKKKFESVVKEEWMPTPEEVKKFCEFLEKYMAWHPEKKIIFFTKPITLSAGKNYKDSNSKNQAMADFGAISLEKGFNDVPEIRVKQNTSNEFMKSGFGRVFLIHQFDYLERKYFSIESTKRKSLKLFDQEGQTNTK